MTAGRGDAVDRRPNPQSPGGGEAVSNPRDQPNVVGNGYSAGLKMLLEIEAASREARTPEELQFLFANETRKLTSARQIFVFRSAPDMRLVTISGLPTVDRSAPVVRAMENAVAKFGKKAGFENPKAFDLHGFGNGEEEYLARYPYTKLLWLPLRVHDGDAFGGLLIASDQVLPEPDVVIAKRMAGTFAHALALLLTDSRIVSRVTSRYLRPRNVIVALFLIALVAMAIPIPMTTLAPMEIKPKDPFIVAAPLEGVIKDVLVAPNEDVSAGQPILKFEDTTLRNRLEVAERQLLVAEARLKKASQLAFDEMRGRHELRLAMAEHALMTAELDFAREMFDRATVRAQRTGIAIYTDRQELIGKPVTVGERVMLIADPTQIEVGIDVNVADAIILRPDARVKVFLDSDPLFARQGKVEYADYQASVRPGNALAFRVVASLNKDEADLPRLGVRGTAQIFGERVPLALYLFRRPLSALRQWIGL